MGFDGKTILTSPALQGSLSGSRSVAGKLNNAVLRGYSAYDIAVQHGFEGTEQEWLDSITNAKIELRENNNILEWKWANETEWHVLADLTVVHPYDTILQFPSIGKSNAIYLTSDNVAYRWNDVDMKYYAIGTDYNTIEIIDGCGRD